MLESRDDPAKVEWRRWYQAKAIILRRGALRIIMTAQESRRAGEFPPQQPQGSPGNSTLYGLCTEVVAFGVGPSPSGGLSKGPVAGPLRGSEGRSLLPTKWNLAFEPFTRQDSRAGIGPDADRTLSEKERAAIRNARPQSNCCLDKQPPENGGIEQPGASIRHRAEIFGKRAVL